MLSNLFCEVRGDDLCASVDTDLALWFHQHLNSRTGPFWQAISFSAGETAMTSFLCAIIVILLLRRKWLGLVSFLITIPGGALLGEAVKLLVQRPRPYLTGPFVDWSGYSFPSGHALSATLLYGVIAGWLMSKTDSRRWRACIGLLSVMIVLMVACSRVALGAHYLTDVSAGMLFGSLWLLLCSSGTRLVRRRLAADAVGASEDLSNADETLAGNAQAR